VYAGDGNFNFSSSAIAPVNIKVAGSDFLIYASPDPLVLTQGQTGAVGLTVDGQAGYNGTINFTPASCSGVPALTTCSFTPTTLTGSGGLMVFVATTAGSDQRNHKFSRNAFWWSTGGLIFFGAVFGLVMPRRRSRTALLVTVIVALMIALPSCGGGGSGTGGSGGGGSGGGGGGTTGGTPLGNYTVTVTATSGSLTHTASFPLVVQ